MNVQYNLPLVSIVIPSYNHAKFVGQTIQSVIDQDYTNIELIIIDDGSQDNSVEVIESYIDKCINRFTNFEFRNRPNKGSTATLNEALEWCKGKYFAPIASDDILLPNKTSIQVNFLEKKLNCAAVGGIATAIDENNNLLKQQHGTVNKHYFEDIFLHKHFLLAPTAMLRLASVKSLGGYDENIAIEDWYMWLKLTQNGDYLQTLNEEFAYYRRHNNNFSKNYAAMTKEREKVIKPFLSHPLYPQAKERIQQINDGDKVKASLGLDVNNKEEFKKILKGKTKVAAYGTGAYFDKVQSVIGIDFYDTLTTSVDMKQIYSEKEQGIISNLDYDLIVVCSSFCSDIVNLLVEHEFELDKIVVAYY